MKLTCLCLNVRLDFSSDPKPMADLIVDLSEKDHFFAQNPRQGTLNLKGEEVTLPCLVNTRLVGSWTINHCKGCHLDTHARASRSSTTVNSAFVSPAMLSDSKAMAALRQSPRFSATFDIVLPETFEQQASSSVPAFKSTISNFFRRISSTELSPVENKSPQLEQSLQARITKFLAEEEEHMNERIAQFTEQQQSAFVALQRKANEDKRHLLCLISGQDPHCDFEPFASTSRKQEPTFTPEPKPSQVASISVSSQRISRRPSSMDADSVFPLDGEDFLLNDEGNLPETFDPLDDEQDTDNEGISIPRHSSSSSYQMARSVPMQVPAGLTLPKEQGIDDCLDSKTPKDPEEIAASIQAMARSIHGNNSFWDVPRPRLNTLH